MLSVSVGTHHMFRDAELFLSLHKDTRSCVRCPRERSIYEMQQKQTLPWEAQLCTGEQVLNKCSDTTYWGRGPKFPPVPALLGKPYLQAVDKKQVELFFISLVQDAAVLNPAQVILHVIFHFTEAVGEKNHTLITAAMLVAANSVLNHDQTTS